jgi:hypothetical protein
MSKLSNAPRELKVLYNQATLFRFKPNYNDYMALDLHQLNESLLILLSDIHLACEKINLEKDDLTWDNYFTVALQKQSYAQQNIKQKIRSTLYAITNIDIIKEIHSPTQVYSFFQLGEKGLLSLTYPYVAYKNCSPNYYNLLKSIFKIEDNLKEEQLKSYLLMWSQLCDTNFQNVLETYNIKLEKK